jgi:hypothetical protein
MANWLYDHQTLVYGFLVCVTVILLVVWRRLRHWPLAAGAAGAVVLIVLVWFFGRASDQQQIETSINEMAAGVRAHNVDRIFAHIAADFRFGSADRANFRKRVEAHLGEVNEVKVWDFVPDEVSRANRTAKVHFMVKAEGNFVDQPVGYLCRADFVLESDGKWRLKGFQLTNPVADTHQPIQIPGF